MDLKLKCIRGWRTAATEFRLERENAQPTATCESQAKTIATAAAKIKEHEDTINRKNQHIARLEKTLHSIKVKSLSGSSPAFYPTELTLASS